MILLYIVIALSCEEIVLNDVQAMITLQGKQIKCPICQEMNKCHVKYHMFPRHTACLQDPDENQPMELSISDIGNIVTHHNKLRAEVNPPAADMMELRWDNELHMLARRWANQCRKDLKGRFISDKLLSIPGRFSVGQNIGFGYDDFKSVTDAWFDERITYQSIQGKPMTNIQTLMQVSHYTQITWASTQLIGCASTKCDKNNLFVCNYGPSGNFLPFTSPYTISFERGDKCKKKTKAGLCDCDGRYCENDSTMDVENCKCNCKYKEVTTKSPTCALNCNSSQAIFCGVTVGYQDKDCVFPYMNTVCPHLCGICPCAETGFVTKTCGDPHTRIPSLILLIVSVYLSVTCWIN